MSSYSGDPASSTRDWVRFEIGDTAFPFEFTDAEINAVLAEQGGSKQKAAAFVLKRWAIRFARLADFTIGRFSESYRNVAEMLNKKADELLKAARTIGAYVGGISQADKDAHAQEADAIAPDFKRGMMESPEAGPTWEDSSG